MLHGDRPSCIYLVLFSHLTSLPGDAVAESDLDIVVIIHTKVSSPRTVAFIGFLTQTKIVRLGPPERPF